MGSNYRGVERILSGKTKLYFKLTRRIHRSNVAVVAEGLDPKEQNPAVETKKKEAHDLMWREES